MPLQAELEYALKVHFDEMENCQRHKCYLALLHLVVVLPHSVVQEQTGTILMRPSDIKLKRSQ